MAPDPSDKLVNMIMTRAFVFLIIIRNNSFSKIIINGIIVIVPRKNLEKVKVKGPTNPIPVAWAMKAVPHINEANKRSKLPFKVFKFYNFFNFIALSLFIHHVSITIP